MTSEKKLNGDLNFQILNREEAEAISGGKINHRDESPPPIPRDPGHGASTYYLPEIEMDTGPIYLP